MTYFVTKYALTKGIAEYDKAEELDDGAIMISSPKRWITYYIPKKDWFDNLADAKERAEDMKRKKIAALQKQIKALEAKSF